MKKIRILTFLMLAFVFTFALFRVTNFSPESKTKADEIAAVQTTPISNYFTISMNKKTLGTENVKIVAPSLGENATRIYIFENGAATINFKPLEYRYSINPSSSSGNFTKNIRTITIPKNPDGSLDSSRYSFKYRQTAYDTEFTYYFQINDGEIYIYRNSDYSYTSLIVSSTSSPDFVSFDDSSEDNIEIYLTESYSLKTVTDSNSIEFPFNAYRENGVPDSFNIIFERPSINFSNKNEEIVEFECSKNSWGDKTEVDGWLSTESSFNELKLKFLNSKYNYTEDVPLYFKINFNGFNYFFKLFIEGDNLFVNYYPNVNNISAYAEDESVVNLATRRSGENIIEGMTSKNDFSMLFNYRGRYALEIFDDTYILNMSNANYYSTSFYIKNESETKQSQFDNIYIISQIFYDETVEVPSTVEGEEPTTVTNHYSEYIVNTSTQNHSVKTTVKNLIDPDSSFELKDIVRYITVGETLYGTNVDITNLTNYTYYVPRGTTYPYEKDIEKVQSTSNTKEVKVEWLDDFIKDGDFEFDSIEDGLYNIVVYATDEVGSNKKIEYSFKVVTKAKATFTVNGVPHSAPENFKLFTENYNETIPNMDQLQFKIKYGEIERGETTKLEKVYENNYSVSYGRQLVSLTAHIEKDFIEFTCQGVGELTVEVTFADETVPYALQSGERLTFYEYGTYTVKITDSMGTTDTQTFKLSKKLNTSSIILIVLSSAILIVIVVFVLISRSKPKTR